MTACPVCVYHATNVPADALHGHKCLNCGQDLGTHDHHARTIIEPGKAYAVDILDALREWPIDIADEEKDA